MAKAVRKSSGGSGGGSSLLAGLLIGLVIGVAVAVGVALFLSKGNSPFSSKEPTPKPDALPVARPQTPSSPEVLHPGGKRREPSAPAVTPVPTGDERYDFYKMLQGNEKPEPRVTAAPRPSVAASQVAPRAGAFLQVGAFQKEEDADNLKAKLALLGIEARIQTTEIPEKGLWHRVRVGPFGTMPELDRMRDTLKQNGIDSAVVKGN